MKRLRIVQLAGFRYAGEVSASYNEARMLPRDATGQQVLSASLEISPSAPQVRYRDYWGTSVVAFEVLKPHTDLTLRAECLVEVTRQGTPVAGVDWSRMCRTARGQARLLEHTRQTPRTAPPSEVISLAADLAAKAGNPFDAAMAIVTELREAMEYVTGATGVSTTAAESWSQRRGVCQDISHLALGALRSVGIPARYVSGYMHPDAEPQVGQQQVAESHAWVEWFAGTWFAFDPTNLSLVADRHVLVARGRDYDDIAPIRGVYAGPTASTAFAEVVITLES